MGVILDLATVNEGKKKVRNMLCARKKVKRRKEGNCERKEERRGKKNK